MSTPARTLPLRILTPIGMLGYGVPEAHVALAMQQQPHAIVVDSGSTDPGPHMLGTGKLMMSRSAYRRDLTILLRAAVQARIPLIVSSAGGAGTDAQVDELAGLAAEIAQAERMTLKLACIYAEVSHEVVRQQLRAGRVTPCGSAPALTEQALAQTRVVVAQMGAEPFVKVLAEQPDVDLIIAGRAYDPAPHAALGRLHGAEPGLYWHMGKVVECGALCAQPKGKAILATVGTDHFVLEPVNPEEACTPTSVAAHTLYEKSRPDLLDGPGGQLDLRDAVYEAMDTRRVRVSHSRFTPAPHYTVKLEGAGVVGYRSVFMGGIRDPILIGQLDHFLEFVCQRAQALYPELADGRAHLHFHVYGRDAVMGVQEPLRDAVPHEVGVLAEVTAPSQELADTLCGTLRVGMLHAPYPGQRATGGNFALPLSPADIPVGPVSRFTVYHLMEVDDPVTPFRIRYRTLQP